MQTSSTRKQPSDLKKSRKRRPIRRIQRTLCILLPILLLLLAALMVISHRLQTKQTQTPAAATPAISSNPVSDPSTDVPSDSADADTPDLPEPADQTDIPVADGSLADSDDMDDAPVTLVFTGDVLLSDYVLNNYNAKGIEGVVSPDLLTELQQADLTVINNEFPFSTRGSQAPDKQFTFRVDPSYVRVLTDMGVDIAGLANNHVLDYGADALLDTFDTLDQAGIDYMGAGVDSERASKLITRRIGGQTFGFLAASRVIPVVSWDVANSSPGVFTTYDPTRLAAAIRDAREQCDYLTVMVHWGIERDEYPQEYQTQLARQYIDAGADLVIGAHPHVLQGVSYYKNKPICYSLGNFIFNQEIPKTAIVKVTVAKNADPIVQFLAASASGAYTSLCTAEQKTGIYQYLEQISDGIVIDSDGILSPGSGQ